MGILQHIEHQISALNDLIRTNNDRIASYEKAIESTSDADLKVLFAQNITDSKAFIEELRDHIHVLGGHPANGTSLSGKVYHTWVDLKARFTKKDRLSILDDCEYTEETANTAYRNACDDKELIWKDDRVVSIISHHLKELKDAGDNIRTLRDDAASMNARLKKSQKAQKAQKTIAKKGL